MTVKIVTDSTSDIPADVAERLDITVVPLNIHFGTDNYKDNVTISADEFYSRLATSSTLPKTSQPSPGDFKEIYDELGANADAIVSIHVSAKLSGTYNSAVQAAAQTSAKCPIEIVDSEQVSMGLGLTAIALAGAANNGASMEEITEVAQDTKMRAQVIGLCETLEYLEKGGRIGKAQSLVGSVLKIKPMIIVKDGEIHELGKGRTFAKSVIKLKEAARRFSPIDSLSVIYSTTPEVALEIADELKDMLPPGVDPYLTRFGPVIGTYAGPGAIGIAVIQSVSE